MTSCLPVPRLGNQFDDDRVLRSYLTRLLPAEVYRAVQPSLGEMGELAGGELYDLQLADRLNEPRHVPWSAWGERLDRIELTPLWQVARTIAARQGLVATAYEGAHGPYSRVHQLALAYLFSPSTDIYSCPLAMTDGATATLLRSGNQELIAQAVPRLTSRDPARFWTSGQWMTEISGGSDVSRSETVARHGGDGWRLWGRKWFASATTSEMALTLARPEGNPPGNAGLALFYVETGAGEGKLRNIRVERLKDKLGTRKVPTAELTLEGTPAEPVMGTRDGVRAIAPMLHLTRTWNSVAAAALMRRGLALARDYAGHRQAFSAPLSEQPLHVDTLAGLQAEAEGAFHLTFRVAELLGAQEAGVGPAGDAVLLRLLTSLAKLTTARQAVAVASEVLEAFGGAGYLEDTGIPVLLRDAQVLPIWEGTTNVLSLEVLQVLRGHDGLEVLRREIETRLEAVRDGELGDLAQAARQGLDRLAQEVAGDRHRLEAEARRLCLSLGRLLELVLLLPHAQWCLDHDGDGRAAAAARRLWANGVSLLSDGILAEDSRALARDEPLPDTAEVEGGSEGMRE